MMRTRSALAICRIPGNPLLAGGGIAMPLTMVRIDGALGGGVWFAPHPHGPLAGSNEIPDHTAPFPGGAGNVGLGTGVPSGVSASNTARERVPACSASGRGD